MRSVHFYTAFQNNSEAKRAKRISGYAAATMAGAQRSIWIFWKAASL